MNTSPQARPLEPRERIAFVDLLRGIAMLLILVENMALYSGQTWDLHQSGPSVEQAILVAIKFLFEAKSYTLLAFLFGWGVAVQQERVEALGKRYVPFHLRRMGFLLIAGLIHGTLVWWGDVLLLYAMLGFALLAFRHASARTLLIAATICLSVTLLINLPGAGMDAVREAYGEATAFLRRDAVPASVYATGTLGEILRRRLQDWLAGHSWAGYYAGTVLGVFLLGKYVARQRWLREAERHRRTMRQAMWASLGIGLILNELYVETFLAYPGSPLAQARFVQVTLRMTGALALVTFYVTAASSLMRSERMRSWLRPACQVGRTSLSNYVLQSLACTTIYYSYGLGLYGQVGIVFSTATAVLVYAGQLRLTSWWLGRHALGPLEWLWREVTYRADEPLSWGFGALRSLGCTWLKFVAIARRIDRRLYYVGAALLVLGVTGLGVWQARRGPIEVIVRAREHAVRVTATPARGEHAARDDVATPVVQAVAYAPATIAANGDLAALASTFDAGTALEQVRTLTGPPYLGRQSASAGGRAAAEYIARRFGEYRLQPAGDSGTYFQPFPIEYVSLAQEPTLTVETVDGTRIHHVPYVDFAPLAKQYAGEGEVRGTAVWGSRCLAEDLAGTDIVGKVVLCRDGPVLELERSVLEQGASGLLLMTDPAQRPADFRVTFGEAWVPTPLMVFRVYPSVVDRLLLGSGYTAEELSSTFAPVPLATVVEAKLSTVGAEVCPPAGCTGRNVLGVLPGRDPEHRHEILVVGAHYDHLGESPNGTAWVGANDDASGVAVLLEIARAWSAEGYVPRRTVLFAAWDAEEMGLLGSQHYAAHPRYPLESTIGMLQLDMVGAGGEVLQFDGDVTMGGRLRAIAESLEIETIETRAGRSDHVPFWQAGVPAGALLWVSGPEETPGYHRPTDTVDAIDTRKLQSVGEVAGIALLSLAEGELGIDDLLAQRAAAAEAGDLEGFLATSVARQRQNEEYWYDDLRLLSPTAVRIEAQRVHVRGGTATASVRIAVTYPDVDAGHERTRTVSLDTRFEYEQGAWRWAGPNLTEDKPVDGGFSVWHPGDPGQGPKGLGHAAAERYAEIAALLGLPGKVDAQLVLLPNSSALEASTAVGQSFEGGVWVGPGTVRMIHTAELSGTVRLDDALVQLALANAGVPADAAPWLWRGLPLVMRAQLGHDAPRLLGQLHELLDDGSGVESEATSWAATAYLWERVGWSGLGEFVAQLGRTCSAHGCGEAEVNAALAGILDLHGMSFSAVWQEHWATELRRMQGALDAVLAARVDAILAGDEDAFTDTVDPTVPGLLPEQVAWFADLAKLEPVAVTLDGRLLAAQGETLLALVDLSYSSAGTTEEGASSDLSYQLIVSLAGPPDELRWSGPPVSEWSGGVVTLLYPESLDREAAALHGVADAAYRELGAILGIDALPPAVIKLYDRRDTFLSTIPPSSAQASGITAWTGKDAPVQLLVSPTGDIERAQGALKIQLARHIVHQVGVDSEWLLEGMSLYLAARLDPALAQPAAAQLGTLLDAVEEGDLPELGDLRPVDDRAQDTLPLASVRAWDTVRYVVERYGSEALLALVSGLEQGLDDGRALQAAIGTGIEQLSAEWSASLARGHAAREWEATARRFSGERSSAEVAYLSSDAFAGRQAGSPAAAASAAYIASRFAEYGLQPAVTLSGTSSYEQHFPISYTVLLEAPLLELLGQHGEVVESLSYRADFVDRLSEAGRGGLAEGEAVWIADPAYTGVELGGRVAVRVPSLPLEAELAQAAEHGASALLLVGKVAGQKLPYAKSALPVALESVAPIPVLELTRPGAERLLGAAGRDLAGLESAPPALPLGIRVRMRIATDGPQAIEVANVLGILRGSDPSLADETIVIAAHYDHVGDDPPAWVCPPPLSAALDTRETTCSRREGVRYPGANDNASGVAVLLEIARLWHDVGYHPRRTVLFAAWAAHEAGQAGMRYYVQDPALALEHVTAVLQLDAVGGGAGYYLGAEGDKGQDGLLRFAMERAEQLLEGRLSLSSPPARDDPVSPFREAGIPALRLRWREASDENWPVQYADEVQPYRLGVTGRMVTLALMTLAGEAP